MFVRLGWKTEEKNKGRKRSSSSSFRLHFAQLPTRPRGPHTDTHREDGGWRKGNKTYTDRRKRKALLETEAYPSQGLRRRLRFASEKGFRKIVFKVALTAGAAAWQSQSRQFGVVATWKPPSPLLFPRNLLPRPPHSRFSSSSSASFFRLRSSSSRKNGARSDR